MKTLNVVLDEIHKSFDDELDAFKPTMISLTHEEKFRSLSL